jgi:hypothetical protein
MISGLNHVDWYELFKDQGSFIGGVLTLLAGAAAYLAGQMQARATKSSADLQVAAIKEQTSSYGTDKAKRSDFILISIYSDMVAIRHQVDSHLAIIAANKVPQAYKVGPMLLHFRPVLHEIEIDVGIAVAQLLLMIDWYNTALTDFRSSNGSRTFNVRDKLTA